MKSGRKVGLFLMTEKGFSVLKFIVSKGLINQVSFVVGAKDQNVVNDYYNDIRDVCMQNTVSFYDRKDSLVLDNVTCIAISWRWIIPNISNLIVLHDSPLPRYRGFSPLVNMLINREPIIAVTALFASSHFDQGPIIMTRSIDVNYPIKISDAITKISHLYNDIVFDLMKLEDPIISVAQDENHATYSLWRDETDYHIDWNMSAAQIQHFINCVGFPYKGALTSDGLKEFRVLESEIYPDVTIENRDVGKVLFLDKGLPVVVCRTGLLKITDLRDENYQVKILEKFRTRFI